MIQFESVVLTKTYTKRKYFKTRQDIREYEKHPKSKHDENDEITKTIHNFFVVLEDGKKWSFDAVNHAVNVFSIRILTI